MTRSLLRKSRSRRGPSIKLIGSSFKKRRQLQELFPLTRPAAHTGDIAKPTREVAVMRASVQMLAVMIVHYRNSASIPARTRAAR
jgi:hypothetical protein